MVAAGTGEALPGPVTCGSCVAGAWRPITGDPGKWSAGRVGVGGGRSTVGAETSSTSRDQVIFVDRAAGTSLPSDAVLLKIDRFG